MSEYNNRNVKGNVRLNSLDGTPTTEYKKCTCCKTTKPVRAFYYVETIDEYKHTCMECWKKHNGRTKFLKKSTGDLSKFMVVGAAAVLGACAKEVPPDAAMSQQEYEYKTAQVEKQIDMMPKWFTSIPDEDNAVFAVGTAITPDMQLAVDIATLAAKTTLADRIDSKLRSQMKTFKGKIGADDFTNELAHEFEQATINLIADADVAGYRVMESAIVPNGTQYRAYVLLEYTDSEASKILKNRVARDKMLMSKLQAKSAWAELNTRVDAMNDDELKEMSIIVDAISDLPVHTPAPVPNAKVTLND